MHYIDTHFHLDLFKDPKSILDQIEKNRIYTIAVTNAPSVFYHTENLTKSCKYIRPALGFHPELVFERKNELSIFLDNIKRTRYIGEVGLDYGKQSGRDKVGQREVFEKIIAACTDYNDKILTIHSRGSYKNVIDILGKNFPNKVIMHWYSGSLKELYKAIDYDYFFSVNLPMTFSEKGRKIISSIPKDKILTESDGPFTHYNEKKFSPLMIPIIIEKLSSILMMDNEECKQLLYKNFVRLIS